MDADFPENSQGGVIDVLKKELIKDLCRPPYPSLQFCHEKKENQTNFS